MYSLKQLLMPADHAVHVIDVVQLWEVRWFSRHGEYSSDIRPELETFLTERDALDFAGHLTAAFKLIRHTVGNRITVTKAKGHEGP